jgi:hypothetical protein
MIKTADKFFDDVDYVSIIDTVKGIFTSDGSMAVLLDFERVLDEADLYAFRNWELGELVQGPVVKRYNVGCMFMWPYKLMPDPAGCKRLLHLGCNILWKKTKIKVPVEVTDYDDFQPGTRYPKMKFKTIWLVYIEMPKEIMDDIREGSVDLAGQSIDLEELDNSYDEDLDSEDQDGTENGGDGQQQTPDMGGNAIAGQGDPSLGASA